MISLSKVSLPSTSELMSVDLEFIEEENGSKLLVDGWWGKARHINYLGDWLMAWSWCLPAGFSTPVPYLYVAYFAVHFGAFFAN